MWSYKQDFEQLSRDLIDSIYLRLQGKVRGFPKDFQFLIWLTRNDVDEFHREIPALKSRITKSPVVHPDALYEQVYWALADKISMYRIVAAMTVLRRSQQEDQYR